MLNAMKGLSDEYKLSYRSIAPVWEALNHLVSEVGTDKSIRYQRKHRPKQAAVMNALICWLEAQPPERRKEIVRIGMSRLNDYLSEADDEIDVSDEVTLAEERKAKAKGPRLQRRRGAG